MVARQRILMLGVAAFAVGTASFWPPAAQAASDGQAATAAEAGAEGGGAAEDAAGAAASTADLPRAEDGKILFRDALTDEPLEFTYRPDQTITPAVEEFHQTGRNPYSGDSAAMAEGEKSYKKLCQACHLADGSGRIGPSLNDDEWVRARTDTEVGRFEIIYGGGAGAMQAFGQRIDQDEILKIMAYIDTFRGEGTAAPASN
jgi:cytochrome c-L